MKSSKIRDLKELQKKTEEVDYNANNTIRSIRRVANKIDDVHWDCETAHAVGTSAQLVGGLLQSLEELLH